MNTKFIRSTLEACKEYLIKIDAGSEEGSELISEMIDPSIELLDEVEAKRNTDKASINYQSQDVFS